MRRARYWVLLTAVAAIGAAQDADQSPVPAEPNVSGTLEIGNRWLSDVRGDFNAWRSVVNLGEGPRLLNLDFHVGPPPGLEGRWLFDTLNFRSNAWGGDPYNTSFLDISRTGAYRLTVDYRNIAYFNFLPSFANPQIDQGIRLNQRSFDTHRRLYDVQLDLMPGRRVTPYFGYTRDSGFGTGVTVFVADVNEYPVSNRLWDHTNNYRGGVRLETKRYHLILEQGGTTFKDDQEILDGGRNRGNRTAPFLGQSLFLDDVLQAYGIRGSSIYSKGILTGNPTNWLDLNVQFLFSQPQTDTSYFQENRGRFVALNNLLFFDGERSSVLAAAKQPHSAGSIGFELRPARRVRILQSWSTNRFHNATRALLADQLLLATPVSRETVAFDRLVVNHNEQRLVAIFDPMRWLSLRAGHRYIWGDARVRASAVQPEGLEGGELRRNVALAGITFRAGRKLTLNADGEIADGDRTYFRTSLQDYKKLVTRARYQASQAWNFNFRHSILANQNPTRTIEYQFRHWEHAASVYWTPGASKRTAILGEYSRTAIISNLTILAPGMLNRELSYYRDFGHTGTVLADVKLGGGALAPMITAGGTYFVSSGSRPTRFYQPVGRAAFPVHRMLHATAEWRWYGFAEPFYAFEGFRAHQFTVGLRMLR